MVIVALIKPRGDWWDRTFLFQTNQLLGCCCGGPCLTFGNLPAWPTVSSCGPLLLRLAPCGPFVQGASPSPTERCCSNLRQLYIQQPDCLCLLLNQTGISTLPINTTLALQLPLLCSMHVDNDTCSGSEGLAPRSSTPQVSFGTNNNSSVAASPMVTVPPKTSSTLGFGFNNSSAVNFNAKESLMIMTVLTSWSALFWF
ncbi:hypothetical protein RDI58_009237 [Solanum bulbocastanum]|uniref:Bifunctional inhibitor/plant lipid transfer protein/seed storage helical domain-containing protein n=1 Tax=Solanum bulbocastanum TaxID=147425 RepID=A0AAN8U4P9_SOLBU